MYSDTKSFSRKAARKIQRKLISEYNIEIMLGAKIGVNPFIQHFTGIVISNKANIGDNMVIRQCVTIGVRKTDNHSGTIHIGKNVRIGANSCIIGDSINIGDNVIIGAMSFVNKNIPANTIFYKKH